MQVLYGGIATAMLIYFFIAYPSDKKWKRLEEKEEADTPEKKHQKSILYITEAIFFVTYIILSFTTMAWHITWVLWIVYAIVEMIIKLVFDLKKEKKLEK